MLFQFMSSLHDKVPQAFGLIESLTGPSKLDIFESNLHYRKLCLGLMIPIASIAYLSPLPIAMFLIASVGLCFLLCQDYQTSKRALLEKKIAPILAASTKNLKKALIIQSAHDTYGALSMRTHIEKVRKLAETHAIERIIIKDKNEFLTRLPSGRFDTVWLRAHGRPTSIEMGKDFLLDTKSSPKIFRLLASTIKERGRLILECCNAANARTAEENIAERIASYCRDVVIFAPQTEICGVFGFNFDECGQPVFNDGFGFKGKDVTRKIRGGLACQRA